MEEKHLKVLGVENCDPFLQTSLYVRNKMVSSFLCIQLSRQEKECVFKASNPIDTFSVASHMIEKILYSQVMAEGGQQSRFLTFFLTGGMRCRICTERNVV